MLADANFLGQSAKKSQPQAEKAESKLALPIYVVTIYVWIYNNTNGWHEVFSKYVVASSLYPDSEASAFRHDAKASCEN